MLSIIIPTMQKDNDILNMLIEELTDKDCIGEIIIIDNSLKGLYFPSNKVRVIIPKSNLYVNPSWNLGVNEAKFEYIGILNDDIIFPQNIFKQIYNFISDNEHCGLVGLDTIPKTTKSEFLCYPIDSEISIYPIDYRCNSWGSAIFGRKENFYEIPENLKIWCGDDYIFKMNTNNGFINYKIVNVILKLCKIENNLSWDKTV